MHRTEEQMIKAHSWCIIKHVTRLQGGTGRQMCMRHTIWTSKFVKIALPEIEQTMDGSQHSLNIGADALKCDSNDEMGCIACNGWWLDRTHYKGLHKWNAPRCGNKKTLKIVGDDKWIIRVCAARDISQLPCSLGCGEWNSHEWKPT